MSTIFVTANENEAIENAAKVLHRLSPRWSVAWYAQTIESRINDLADATFGHHIGGCGFTVTRMKFDDEPHDNGYEISLNIATLYDNDIKHFVYTHDGVGPDVRSEKFPPPADDEEDADVY